MSINRPGGYGREDIWVCRRQSMEDGWGPAVNLGPKVNTSACESQPCISADGMELYFSDVSPWGTPARSGGHGGGDIWVTRRANRDDEWAVPVNLGPMINTPYYDMSPSLSDDGCTLHFTHNDTNGWGGNYKICRTTISPVVDLNGDGNVDCADMCIMVDHWGTDNPLCDIGPMPWGDGIVDVQNLIVLAEHFEKITTDEEINVDEDDADGQIELEQGQILVVTLESNPTTGYRWEQAENQ